MLSSGALGLPSTGLLFAHFYWLAHFDYLLLMSLSYASTLFFKYHSHFFPFSASSRSC